MARQRKVFVIALKTRRGVRTGKMVQAPPPPPPLQLTTSVEKALRFTSRTGCYKHIQADRKLRRKFAYLPVTLPA